MEGCKHCPYPKFRFCSIHIKLEFADLIPRIIERDDTYLNLCKIDKLNCLGLADVLITLFFEPFYEECENGIKLSSLQSFYKKCSLINSKNDRIDLSNPHIYDEPYITKYPYFKYLAYVNLNNTEIINKFVNSFIIPFDDIPDASAVVLKQILYDSETQKGLLSNNYESILSYTEVLHKLSQIIELDNDIAFRENIGDLELKRHYIGDLDVRLHLDVRLLNSS